MITSILSSNQMTTSMLSLSQIIKPHEKYSFIIQPFIISMILSRQMITSNEKENVTIQLEDNISAIIHLDGNNKY